MNFLLISHGPMAASALASAEMIMGRQENVRTLAVTHDTTLEGMEQEIAEVYEGFGSQDLMIFCDILGGTPSNASLRFKAKQPEVEVITGFNLPVLIEAFMAKDLAAVELLEVVKTAYSNGQSILEAPVTAETTEAEMMDL